MSKKITFLYIKEVIEHNGYSLLSNEFINSKTYLDMQCPLGHIFHMDWNHFQQGQRCPICAGNRRLSYDFVKKYIESFNYSLLSTEYKNAHKKLEIECDKGHIFPMNFDHFKRGNRCPFCSPYSKTDGDIVYSAFIEKDYTPLFKPDEYIKATIPLPYICPNHQDKGIQYLSYGNIKQNRGCRFCGIESYSGENCHLWRGGVTELNHYLRESLKEWVKNSLEKTNYTCFLTGINQCLEIHHLLGFNLILQQVLKHLQIPLKNAVSEYASDELNNIKNEFLKYHTSNLGIPLLPEIHTLFHTEYGFGDNTPEQFNEFSKRFESGEFNDFLSTLHIINII